MTTKSPAKRKLAVILAKDVIKQVKSGLYTPERGGYFHNLCNFSTDTFSVKKGKVNTKDLLKDNLSKTNSCELCAVAALFLSKIMVKNNHYLKFEIGDDSPIHNIEDNSKCHGFLYDAFSEDELDQIVDIYDGDTSEVLSQHNDEEALIAIMKNIITYKGVFTPSKLKNKKGITFEQLEKKLEEEDSM